MKKVFISYRREDSAGYAGRLQDSLTQAFSAKNIFFDLEAIKPGENFEEAIKMATASYDVFIILIGKQWATIEDEKGQRRLNNPNDYVRLEVTAALNSKARVIPVLVRGAEMPKPEDLPEPLLKLLKLQALTLSDHRWNYDTKKLVNAIGNSNFNFWVKQHSTPVLGLVLALLLSLFFVLQWMPHDQQSGPAQTLVNQPSENSEKTVANSLRSEAEQSVLSLEKEISYLRGTFESIGSYDHAKPDHSRDIVETKAAALARRLENIQDGSLPLQHQILKYDAVSLAYVMAASVESDKKKRTTYASKTISNGEMALRLIEKAFDRAQDGGTNNLKMLRWFEQQSKKEYVLYVLAVAHAIKVRDGNEELIDDTKKIIDTIPKPYLRKEPLEKDRNLKWFLENY